MRSMKTTFAMAAILNMVLASTLFAKARASSDYTTIENKAKVEILTPSLSNIERKKIQLNNGLKVYLVSDPSADKSGVALSVEVGFWEDPKNHAGMAHFLEHMLFLGTEKYPEEGAFQKYVGENSGMANASTSSNRTVYEFQINNEAFAVGLDRFSQFFIHPLFNPSGVDREMHAVDQELASIAENDNIRLYAVTLALGNPSHPNSTFGCGNLQTLSEITQKELIEWYKKYYSANIMNLSVYSNLPMSQLVAMVVKDFALIPNRHVTVPQWKEPLTNSKNAGDMVYISPVKDIRRLFMLWELSPEFAHDMDYHTTQLVGFLLRNQDTNSLYTLLKEKGLINDLNAWGEEIHFAHALFFLEIDLTDKGVKEVDRVIEYCYQAINTIKDKNIPNYLSQELKEMAMVHYEYQSRKNVFNQVQKSAIEMIYEDLSTYPEKSGWATKFDSKRANTLLNELVPNKCLYLLNARPELTNVEPDREEKWTHAPYKVKSIPKARLLAWSEAPKNSHIMIPRRNPFIPENLKPVNHVVFDNKQPIPQLLVHNDFAQVYYVPDNNFGVPEIDWKMYLNTPSFRSSPQQKVLIDLYITSVNEGLTSYAYMASVAGMNYSLTADPELGLKLSITGYSEKAPLFLKEILSVLKSVHPTEEEFKIYKTLLSKRYANALKETPVRQALDIVSNILYKDLVSPADKFSVIQDIKYADLLDFINQAYDELYIRGLLYGNITEKEAKCVFDEVDHTFLDSNVYPIGRQPMRGIIDLAQETKPQSITKTIDLNGNATVLLIGEGSFSFEKRAAQQIMQKAIKSPFFDTLRTKQQTGYAVFSTSLESERQLFSYFAVQSNTHSPRDLLSRFELFNEEFIQELNSKEFTAKEFEGIKKAEIIDLRQPPKNLYEMAGRLALLAFYYGADFEWINKRIQGLEALTYSEYIDFVNKYLNRDNMMRISILIEGEKSDQNRLNYNESNDIDKLREDSVYTTRDAVQYTFVEH